MIDHGLPAVTIVNQSNVLLELVTEDDLLQGVFIEGDEDVSLVDAIQTDEQRVVFDRITALMSLLEGHADHVMDAVGPDVVPSVVRIRKAFDAAIAGTPVKTVTPSSRRASCMRRSGCSRWN